MGQIVDTGELKYIVGETIQFPSETEMTLEDHMERMFPAIEKELQFCVEEIKNELTKELYQMLSYHLGWEKSEDDLTGSPGKRIRPLLMLITTSALGSDWRNALPAAASIELIHNFSLIHDDIQDNGEMRRGRETVWKKWGTAQAINAGDAMFSLAHRAMFQLQKSVPSETILLAVEVVTKACMWLAQGQYLDLAYEDKNALAQDAYWYMATRKTAALLAASTEVGAILAGANGSTQAACRKLGELLGLAFQAKDDYLGIWGDEVEIGKSRSSDLISKKKSLPIIYALEAKGEFASVWNKGAFAPNDIPYLVDLLEREGAREYTDDMVNGLTDLALGKIQDIPFTNELKPILTEMAVDLLKRES